MSLKPDACPFCGCQAIAPRHTSQGRAWWRCLECETTGPVRPTIEKALKAWNSRAATQ